MTKAQRAEMERKEIDQRVRAMDCLGCPYAHCPGSTSKLTRDEQTQRFREAVRWEGEVW